ncbi:MAG: SIMPL domain-containing protein [Defluviitaleaceae bacterium]|nr:SIMPL domain-containing protein [Defluviitaleaceae bacterium]
MKKAIMAIVLILVLTLPVYVSASQWDAEIPPATITISGTGGVDVSPDMATVTFGVRVEETTAAAAQRVNNEIMERLLASVTGLGVPEGDIVTTNFSLRQVFTNVTVGGRTQRQHTGYEVNASIRVTIYDLDLVGYVLSAAGTAGVTSTGNVVFSISDRNAAFNQALALATESAKSQATVIADTLGVRIVGIRSVNAQGGQRPVLMVDSPVRAGPGAVMEAEPAMAPTPVLAGDLTVTASVSIVFLIAP